MGRLLPNMPGTTTPTLPGFILSSAVRSTAKVVSVNPYPCLTSVIFNRLATAFWISFDNGAAPLLIK